MEMIASFSCYKKGKRKFFGSLSYTIRYSYTHVHMYMRIHVYIHIKIHFSVLLKDFILIKKTRDIYSERGSARA